MEIHLSSMGCRFP